MLKPNDAKSIFVYLSAIDMRKSIDGLAAIVLDEFEQLPQSGDLFVFHNKGRDKIKLIYWDRNGFVLFYKRLERGRFKLSKTPESDKIDITTDQLQWLLAGLDFQLMQSFNELNYQNYY